MPSVTCGSCKAKKANRPGTLCYACWVAAGKPTAEEAKGLRVRLDKAKAVVEVAAPLTADSVGELEAFRWVTTHGPGEDRTWEQKSAREFKESSPGRFYDRKARLEEAESASGVNPLTPERKWDGVGACPCCGLEKERPIEDAGTSKILAMLAELDGGAQAG